MALQIEPEGSDNLNQGRAQKASYDGFKLAKGSKDQSHILPMGLQCSAWVAWLPTDASCLNLANTL